MANNTDNHGNGNKPPVQSRAPYNFVPFCDQPIRWDDLPERLPMHDEIDETSSGSKRREQLPRHDVIDETLLTGEIHVTFTAETEICVGDIKGNSGDFVTGPDGKYQIPGSTLRGLIRGNMQILGMGLVRTGEDFADRRLYYRSLADAKDTLTSKRKCDYHTALGIHTHTMPGASGQKKTSYSTADKVRAGYLHREGDRFFIVPAKGNYLSVSRKAPIASPWKDQCTICQKIWYSASGNKVTGLWTEQHPGSIPGMLVIPGAMAKQNRIYIFPEENRKADPIELSKEDWLSYEEDFKARKNGLEGTQKTMTPEYWALPKSGEVKAVFFVRQEGRVLFGTSQFLRIPYLYRLSHGLPERHKQYQDKPFLDYPSAIMGFTRPQGELQDSYRSRVCVGALTAAPGVKTTPQDAVLGGPKPTFFPNYTEEGRDYNQEGFRLRGVKHYWMKSPCPEVSDKQTQNSRLHLLPRGTAFSGVIRYRNLYPDELGLLLWCIIPDEKKPYHTIGKGKPYGYGRVKASITAIREFDPRQLYSGYAHTAPIVKDCTQRRNALIDGYQKTIQNHLRQKKSILSISHIQEFMCMKRTICPCPEDVSYMPLKDFRHTTIALGSPTAMKEEWNSELQRQNAARNPGKKKPRWDR